MRLLTVNQIVERLRSGDEATAVNANMLRRLLAEHPIQCYQRGSRVVVEFEEVYQLLRQLVGLMPPVRSMRIRTIRDACAFLQEKKPDLGLSEDRIRVLVQRGIIPSIVVGNRHYIALEYFEEPYVRKVLQDETPIIIRPKVQAAVADMLAEAQERARARSMRRK